MFIKESLSLPIDNLGKRIGLQTGSPDQNPVDVRLSHQFFYILRFDAAAILDAHLFPDCRPEAIA